MKYSHLFWPVRFRDNAIYVLDETLLPDKLSYIKIRDYQAACKAIKEMKTRAVGQVLLVLYTFLLAVRQKKDLSKVAKAINATRPTLAFKFLTDIVLNWAKSKIPLDRAILGFLEILRNKRIE